MTTCFEDWQNRRNRLMASGDAPSPWNAPQLKIFKYLIQRYCDSPEAHEPAHVPMGTDRYWNDRRIRVHHHLQRDQIAGVQSKSEAEARVAGIVRRMASDDPPGPSAFVPSNLTTVSTPWKAKVLWNEICRGIKRGSRVDSKCRRLLSLCGVLPAEAVRHLAARVSDASKIDTAALELLLKCRNRTILDSCVRAWRQRLAASHSNDEVTIALEERFRATPGRERAAERIREALADDDRFVRIAATRLLAELGDLNDIGFLSDLVELPDTTEDERRELVAAMDTIAMQDWKKDL